MKFMKKLSVFVFAMVMFVSMIEGANAYTKNITTMDTVNIDLPYLEYADKQYVSLKGEKKSTDAKVYIQEIFINKDTYDQLLANSNEREEYTNNNTAESVGETFTEKVRAFDTKEKGLIPDFNDNNWQELTLTNSTDTENQYAASISGKNKYFVVWVKVTLNGVDWYNYGYKCIDNVEPETTYSCKIVDGKYYGSDGSEITKEQYSEQCDKKVCRIVDGKYYDKNGKEVTKDAYYKACPNPKTGRNTYYTYGIITVIGACILYMFTRRIKKFSK